MALKPHGGKKMKNCFIIADDFTGSNDTGVQLRRKGIATRVVLRIPRELSPGESLVVDTESRSLPADEARKKLTEALAGVDFRTFDHVIKKVDSTLRGNIGPEIAVVDRCMQSELVIFMPALPDLGRTTEAGIHHMNGVRITDTELRNDPKTPVTEDNIVRILEAEYKEPIGFIGLEDIAAGNIDLSGARVFAADAVMNEDMLRVIRAAEALGKRTLYVGTAAMADNLYAIEQPVYPSMGLVASVSAVTSGQVKAAGESGAAVIQVPADLILSGKADAEQFIAAAEESLRAGKDTLVVSSATVSRDELGKTVEAGAACGMTPEKVSAWVAGLMGDIGCRIAQNVPVSGIFLAGGDTAISLIEKADADGAEILGEVAIGIPLMRLSGGTLAGLRVITKAGAFGKPDAIQYSLRKLKEVL